MDAAGRVLNSSLALEEGFEHLAKWLSKVETLWEKHGKGSRPFRDQINYIGQLASQFPVSPLRVIYTKSGTLPAACLLKDGDAVVDQKLFWSRPKNESEAYYLIAILNSEAARSRAERYQSRGLFGTRDFDKVMFNLPIPVFDAKLALHAALAKAGSEAEEVAALVELKEGEKFQRARKRVRDALIDDGIAQDIEKLVEKLLGPV